MSRKRSLAKGLALLVLLVVGGMLCVVLILTAPETVPEEKQQAPTFVQAIEVSPRTVDVKVTAYGPVIPARKVTIKPQVAGLVREHHPSLVPGGYLQEGEALVRIERSDYQLALNEQESLLEEARYQLEVEKGRQVVAEREWELLSEDLPEAEVNQSLVLREPHLRRAEALILKATNDIARAQLNLSRTLIRAPFNAMVLEESVETGQLVENGSAICTLVGTDGFWVQATLPLDQLGKIRLPGPDQTGSAAAIYLDTGEAPPPPWSGRVVRLLSDLDPVGRMARVLVEVEDPLGLRQPETSRFPLLLGSYVRAEIDAGQLEDVIVVPRSALREGSRLWWVDPESRLRISDARVLWSQGDKLYVENAMRPGERLIVSRLKAPLPGMKLEVPPAAQETGAEPSLSSVTLPSSAP